MMKTDYFSGLDFLYWGAKPNHTEWIYRNPADYYTLQYVHSGSMYIGLDDDKNVVRYEAPFAWHMYKGRYFRFGDPDGGRWGNYYVAFKGPRMQKFIESKLYPINLDPPIIKINNPDYFLNQMFALFDCLKKSPQKKETAVHILEGLLLATHHQDDNRIKDFYHADDLFKLSERIIQKPEINWDFEKEALKINVSFSHFRMLFRKLNGRPPQQFLIECRLKKAESMLLTTRKSIAEIAEESGIGSVYYFSRLFASHYHVPPCRYRNDFR